MKKSKINLLSGLLFMTTVVCAMTENKEQQWRNAPRYNSDSGVIYITNAVPVIDDENVDVDSIVIPMKNNNIIPSASMMPERQAVSLAVASFVGQQENRINASAGRNQVRDDRDSVSNRTSCCCLISACCEICCAGCRECCYPFVSCVKNCPKCCVVSDIHHTPDGLCCPSTAKYQCGPCKCRLLYSSNTGECIGMNAVVCCFPCIIPCLCDC